MENKNENLEFDTSEYTGITVEDVYIDNNQSVITTDDLKITPFDVIKAHAEKLGVSVVDPKANCKKCYGRGYIGRDSVSKAPVPCSCIYVDTNDSKNQYMYNVTRKRSRKERRQMLKQTAKMIKRGSH